MKRLLISHRMSFILVGLLFTLCGCGGSNKTVTLCDCMTKGYEYSTPGTYEYQICQQKFRQEFGEWNDLDNPKVRSMYNKCKGRKVI